MTDDATIVVPHLAITAHEFRCLADALAWRRIECARVAEATYHSAETRQESRYDATCIAQLEKRIYRLLVEEEMRAARAETKNDRTKEQQP